MKVVVCILIAIALLFQYLQIRKLQQRVARVESSTFGAMRGLPGREGGMEHGVFGAYSTSWNAKGIQHTFIPNTTGRKGAVGPSPDLRDLRSHAE